MTDAIMEAYAAAYQELQEYVDKGLTSQMKIEAIKAGIPPTKIGNDVPQEKIMRMVLEAVYGASDPPDKANPTRMNKPSAVIPGGAAKQEGETMPGPKKLGRRPKAEKTETQEQPQASKTTTTKGDMTELQDLKTAITFLNEKLEKLLDGVDTAILLAYHAMRGATGWDEHPKISEVRAEFGDIGKPPAGE